MTLQTLVLVLELVLVATPTASLPGTPTTPAAPMDAKEEEVVAVAVAAG
jgi:hypothetical protein